MTHNNYSAVILAAGYSSRMGTLKPLLPVMGVPAIRRVVEIVKKVGASPIVVTGHRAGEIVSALDGSGAVIAENAGYDRGMLSSVQTGVSALPDATRAFFLLPGDCCAVRPETLVALMQAFESGDETAIFPTFDARRGHPPIIPRALAAPLLEYSGEGGAKSCLSRYPGADLPVADPGVLLDMDTPQDYAALLEYLGGNPLGE
ncbi:MAG: nucleotidyltransferase family protein [Oscillospiraceae bacterium]|jgi:CTP:molybdopterin cytidylyltransferase MocA|nr:nucleotidyltransferase family protein [Oscillospiraceae bacterium]